MVNDDGNWKIHKTHDDGNWSIMMMVIGISQLSLYEIFLLIYIIQCIIIYEYWQETYSKDMTFIMDHEEGREV